MKSIAIIGGGAAGLAAAVAAAEEARARGVACDMRIFEADDRIGRSILVTGNGRCNFSNARIDCARYHNADYATDCLQSFEALMQPDCVPGTPFPNGVVAFFWRHGLMWREEAEGRLYPQANKASVVLDVLRSSAKGTGVTMQTSTRIAAVEPPRAAGKPFTLRTSEGVFERADQVIVACGGTVARNILPDGLGAAYREPVPVLCPLATETHDVCELNNIRVKAAATLVRNGAAIAHERGEVLFRTYGISGIAVFNLSRAAQPGDVVSLDLMPDMDDAELQGVMAARVKTLAQVYGVRMTYGDMMRGMVLPLVADVLLSRCDLKADACVAPSGTVEQEIVFSDTAKRGAAPASSEAINRIAHELKHFRLPVKGLAEPEHAQVHRGGFDPFAFDPSTMESLAQPGLHMVGEALDVDGPCGGYNLHWAFATGILAGTNAARSS